MHQLEYRGHAKAAFAGQRGRLQQRAFLVAGAGEADADLMAAEDRVLSHRRRMFLIEDLALPATILRAVRTEIIERGVAAQDAAFIQQHDAGQASLDAVEHADMNGIEAVDDAADADAAGDRYGVLFDG